MSLLTKNDVTEEELPKLVAVVAKILEAHAPYVIWLDGPMGAGKSTFVRHYLRHMGLNPRVPVVSPTYTIMNEYEVNGKWFAHLDLYRAQGDFSLEELGLDVRAFQGIFFEWYQAPGKKMAVTPSHRLIIEPQTDLTRNFRLELYS